MTRKKTGLLFLAVVLTSTAFPQSTFKPNYLQLLEYEGLYEYVNGSTLQIAASPKDTILMAIIHKSNYPLLPFSRDVFLNSSKEEVRFFRDPRGRIAGYSVNKDSFQLINHQVFFPKAMWYPRLQAPYTYIKPKKENDGLPTGDLHHAGLEVSVLANMMRRIIDGDYPNVHSILIIKDGKLVFEEYFYEYSKDSLQELRSATKSIISALTGIAIDKGYIKSKTEKVLAFFPEYRLTNMSPLKQQITIENMLSNASGLDCDISNETSAGNETKMDYSDDWVKYTLDLPMIDTPGGKGMYCSGNPVTIGRIIEKASRQPLPGFANQYLFYPLGITNYKWNFKPDQSNAEDFCQVYLTPRAMAKFGMLYLNGCKWKGKQLVDSNWVKLSFEKHSVVQGVDYGYLWWLKYLDANGTRYYGKAAQGNGGQKIYIWPQLNMVTVLTGGNYNRQSPSDELISQYILPSLKKN